MRTPALSDSAALAFVGAFYAAYAPAAVAHGLQATDSLVAASPELFAPTLLAALRQDRASREAAAAGELDGLNFEPFLATQDPCERYQPEGAHRVVPAAPTVSVNVYAICDGRRDDRPVVVAEVQPAGRSWIFVNFQYQTDGKSTDLLGTLRELHPSK